jgi:hypothetical protein
MGLITLSVKHQGYVRSLIDIPFRLRCCCPCTIGISTLANPSVVDIVGISNSFYDGAINVFLICGDGGI